MIASWIAVALAMTSSGSICPTGLYQSPTTHEYVAITEPQAGNLRFMFGDGRRGSLAADDSPLKCTSGKWVARGDAASPPWSTVALRMEAAEFTSHGTKLSGTLIEPPGGPHPLVVLVHGSERTSPLTSPYPYIFASYGLTVFAYDKRGTGKSAGEYTQNFELLADDAAAAMKAARRLAGGRFDRAGYFGGSQGGWVAPLAATRTPVDFVAVGFGLIESPIGEDREQVLSEMRAKGYGAADLAAAAEVAEATGLLVGSNFTTGFDRLAAVRRRYGSRLWFTEIQGEFTGDVLRESEADLHRSGRPLFDNLELIWNYDGPAVIRRVKAPQLWVLAEADREAPSETTLASLLKIRGAGADLTIYSFPDTDHGMTEFVEAPDGTRTYTRVTDGYFRLLADWIKGARPTTYGRARKH